MEGIVEHKGLRILMTTDTVGGVWSYSIELCKALLPFGVHFYLITTGAPMQPAQKADAEKLENVTVYETDFMLEWMDLPWESIDASGEWLLQLEDELQPDLIHLNCFAYGSLPWKAPVIVVAHSDVCSWWQAVLKEEAPATWNEYYNRVKRGLEQADLVIAPSETMMEDIRSIYLFNTPGKIIYNAKSSTDFYPAQKEPYVFSMGRIWDEAKNIELLVQAAPEINYPIRIAGDNSFDGNHVDIDAASVSYLGKLSSTEVAEQLSRASVYVLPANYEPFGLSVLEAALSGCALVLGNIRSLQEIWGDSAIYVDTDNPTALAATVNELLANEEKCNEYAQKAMRRAGDYSIVTLAQKYLQVYGDFHCVKLLQVN